MPLPISIWSELRLQMGMCGRTSAGVCSKDPGRSLVRPLPEFGPCLMRTSGFLGPLPEDTPWVLEPDSCP